MPTSGCCYLVGAVPGSPSLLTTKALRLIQAATLLLVDDLVSPEIVALASPRARVIHVGKRGGRERGSQAFIEKLMIMAARQGELVVRLKGGEPFVLGRGGEEAQSLRAAGVPVQVVNGITSGLTGSTGPGFPLIHRAQVRGASFTHGHLRRAGAAQDWKMLGQVAHPLGLMLLLYMGVSSAAGICLI